MRPTISHFIRYGYAQASYDPRVLIAVRREILYPKLEDNELVTRYPPVQGMQKDVFFFNHLNKENGTEDSVSKFNMFEVSHILRGRL